MNHAIENTKRLKCFEVDSFAMFFCDFAHSINGHGKWKTSNCAIEREREIESEDLR